MLHWLLCVVCFACVVLYLSFLFSFCFDGLLPVKKKKKGKKSLLWSCDNSLISCDSFVKIWLAARSRCLYCVGLPSFWLLVVFYLYSITWLELKYKRQSLTKSRGNSLSWRVTEKILWRGLTSPTTFKRQGRSIPRLKNIFTWTSAFTESNVFASNQMGFLGGDYQQSIQWQYPGVCCRSCGGCSHISGQSLKTLDYNCLGALGLPRYYVFVAYGYFCV